MVDSTDNKYVEPEQLLSVCNLDDTYKTIVWRGLNIVVRNMIKIEETLDMVNSIMEACTSNKDGVINCYPELMDFAVRANVVLRYSNVHLPADTREQYKILYGTDLYDVIRENTNKPQIASIENAVTVCLEGLYWQTR